MVAIKAELGFQRVGVEVSTARIEMLMQMQGIGKLEAG